ncbi:dihydroorotate dehydrogenase-like protein [bacterium]|nr:dihydroorotate dehydrogenase-like protein [bacterium]
MDLSTRYLGFDLPHPLVPSASPLTDNLDNLKRLEDAGAPMAVLRSLFEEQVVHESRASEHFQNLGTDCYAEALTYLPPCSGLEHGLEQYLDLVRKAKAALSIPIVASLNGASSGGWTRAAGLIEEAGADALELNEYYLATDMECNAAQVEDRCVGLLKSVKETVRFPVTVKLSPFFSSLPHFARRLVEAGADGLVLFNRFYQPDIDIESLELYPHLQLSTSNELRLPLRWIAILHGRLRCDLAATTGIHTAEDAVKATMAGAAVCHMCSALLQKGPGHIGKLKTGLAEWLEAHEYHSLRQALGSMSLVNCPDPAALERANYLQTLYSWESP